MNREAVRHRIQQMLVYFGLAEEPGAPREERRRDLFVLIAAPVLFVTFVIDDRGSTLGAIVAGLFVPALVIGSPISMMRRVSAAMHRLDDPQLLAPLAFAVWLLLLPGAWGVWPAAAAALATTVLFTGAVWRGQRNRRLERRDRERLRTEPLDPTS